MANQTCSRLKRIGMVKGFLILSFALLCIPRTVSALDNEISKQHVETPFNVREVIEKVTYNQMRTGEFLIDTNIVYVPEPDMQHTPSVAFDGTNYLVVWEDGRNSSFDIYGARVAQNGTVLDPSGIAISTAANTQEYPSVAFDGTNYLVVWHDARSYSTVDIYGTRVAQNGTVLDPSGIPISTAANDQKHPSVAFDGTNYLVVWEDGRNGPADIYGARVSTSGTVFDPQGIPISTVQYYDQVSPSVAFDGTNYLVVWHDSRSSIFDDIYGARVAQNGTVLDPSGIAISSAYNYQLSPSVAFDGTNYLVVWHDSRSGSGYSDIYGARVNPSGMVIDSFAVSIQADSQITPALAHGQGNQLLIVYSGFIDYINNHPANTMRIWGKFYPFTGIEEGEAWKVNDERFKLEVFPNPFYSSVQIKYALEKSSGVTLKIYNVAGECVKILMNAKQNAGVYEINWDGRDDKKRKLPKGIYFLRMETETYITTEKMVLLH
ncbi:MAG: FlgD immunoglobulin-like domain containing protein [candidate division WOR-3 bacterium]